MTDFFFVDTSLAAKWFLAEPHQAEARALRELHEIGHVQFCAPTLLLSEVGHVFVKQVRRGWASPRWAMDSFAELQRLGIIFVDVTPAFPAALELALAHGQSFYDALYLALALHYSCGLVTADERFYCAVRQDHPQVIYLPQFPFPT